MCGIFKEFFQIIHNKKIRRKLLERSLMQDGEIHRGMYVTDTWEKFLKNIERELKEIQIIRKNLKKILRMFEDYWYMV